MSALGTAVQARYAEDTLIALTRRKDTTTASIDTTVLELACTDVTAGFEIYVGELFDATDAQHLMVACMGVIARLKSWTRESPAGQKDDWEVWTTQARDLAKITSRDRSPVVTTSLLTPTEESTRNGPIRPVFDDNAFDGYQVNRP